MQTESDYELDFDSWMVRTGFVFSTQLTGEEKLKFLSHMIRLCSASEIHEFTSELPDLLYRDFITLLPTELLHIILSYLDVKTLLMACQVCQDWNRMICVNERLWRQHSTLRGFRIPQERHEDAFFYKQLFLRNSRVRWWKCSWKRMELDKHGEGVTALYYYDGMVATGGQNKTVCLWCCKTDYRLALFETHSTSIFFSASAIKFDDQFLVVAYGDMTVASWNFATGQQLQRYVGHVADVFCVDFDSFLDVLVAGSADGTLKLWSFSTGDLLRTLEAPNREIGCELWIWSVRLLCYPNLHSRFNILATCMHSVCHWTMNVPGMTVSNFKVLYDLTSEHDHLVGWELDGSTLIIVTRLDVSPSSNTLRETSYEFDESVGGGFVVRKSDVLLLSKDIDIYKYLGSGKCFSAFLGRHDEKVTLCITRRSADVPPILIYLRPKCWPTKGAIEPRVTLCDRRWMDGLSEEVLGEPVLAAIFFSDSVRILKFGPDEKLE